jgi:glycosidase
MNKLLTLALLICPGQVHAAPVSATSLADWEGQIIYQVMPDRFAHGDTGPDLGADPEGPQTWHGGNLKGLTGRLGYVTALGATAVWLTPVYRQVAPVNGMTGYHGYWPADFRSVDPHFGTLTDFQALTAKAHSLGLKVMLDQVINHYGYGTAVQTAHPDWFHTQSDCSAAPLSLRDSVCPLAGLPDLNQKLPAVATLLAGNADFWRTQGVDAFRYDAVKNVDQAFLRAQVQRDRAAGTFTLGEYYGADADRIEQLQNLGLSSLFDFALQNALKGGVMSGQGLNGVREVLQQDARTPHPGLIAAFLDNHDLPRFASGTLFEDQGQARTAYALRALMTLKGIPVIWQGTEYAQRGGADPDNRRDMRFPDRWTAGEKAVYDAARDAIAVRKASPALSLGDQVVLDVPDALRSDLLVFTRSLNGSSVLVAWNSSKARTTYSLKSALRNLPLSPSLFHEPDGGPQKAGMSISGGYLHLSLPAQTAAVFAFKSSEKTAP